MREAKRRNPKIYLDVLQWGAPDWIGDRDFPDTVEPNTLTWAQRIPRGRKKFFTKDNVDFIVAFLDGAKRYHGLDINYCGVWNETPWAWDEPRATSRGSSSSGRLWTNVVCRRSGLSLSTPTGGTPTPYGRTSS